MSYRNDGSSDDSKIQNRFTAYLQTAVQRRKSRYIRSKSKVYALEVSRESLGDCDVINEEPDMSEGLPILEQISNKKLYKSLKSIDERNLDIFIARVINEKSFTEIANETGYSYRSIALSYYRTIEKIKKDLGGKL